MGLFDKFKKKEEKQETVITPQVNNEMVAESNNLGQNVVAQIEQSYNVAEEVPTLPENQFVDNSTPVVEQPAVENTQPQPNVPSFDNIFNAKPADLIPTQVETYTPEQISETVLATGAQVEESKPIVEQQIALDVNIEDVVEGGTTKEDEITRIVSETVANRDKNEKQNDAIIPDIEDVTSKVEPAPVVEIPTPVVEVQAPVVEIPTPVVEVQTPVVEEPTPVVEVQAPVVEMPTPVVEEPAPVVEIPTPVVEAPTPVAEITTKPTIVLSAVEDEAEIELPSNPFEENIETPQMVEESTPVVEVQAPVVEEPAPVVEVPVQITQEPTQVEEIPIVTVEVQTTEPTSEINIEANQEITTSNQIADENDLSNEVQSFEESPTLEEKVEEEPIQPQIEEQEENYEPVIVQEEPAELAPANINDPIVEKKIVDNSPILPQEEQNSISEEQLVERKEEPRSYIEEKKKITRFCDECGTMVTDDGVVCPECGMPIK